MVTVFYRLPTILHWLVKRDQATHSHPCKFLPDPVIVFADNLLSFDPVQQLYQLAPFSIVFHSAVVEDGVLYVPIQPAPNDKGLLSLRSRLEAVPRKNNDVTFNPRLILGCADPSHPIYLSSLSGRQQLVDVIQYTDGGQVREYSLGQGRPFAQIRMGKFSPEEWESRGGRL